MLYFTEVSFGPVGVQTYHVFEASNLAEAEETARGYALENAESYGYYYHEELCGGCYGTVVLEEDVEGWETEGQEPCTYEIDFSLEPYEPEKHDMYAPGGTWE